MGLQAPHDVWADRQGAGGKAQTRGGDGEPQRRAGGGVYGAEEGEVWGEIEGYIEGYIALKGLKGPP